jgi:hypothetical protein
MEESELRFNAASEVPQLWKIEVNLFSAMIDIEPI